jgi:hypothetical protein
MAKKRNRKHRPYERKEAITPIEYGGLQQAYDHFNATLFADKLPDVFITYQRRHIRPDTFRRIGFPAEPKNPGSMSSH